MATSAGSADSPLRNPRVVELMGLDDLLVAEIDGALSVGTAAAGSHVVCRVGCTACCIGLFDISALDAARVLRGLDQLRDLRVCAATALVERAHNQWHAVAGRFPGDAATAVLDDEPVARERFFAEMAQVPCAALDSDSGACQLYHHRPLACRSFGLPVRIGAELLPPCSLNFAHAAQAEIAAAAVEIDPNDREVSLIAEIEARAGVTGDTLVCAVLGGFSWRRS
jgi:Fe-S-cluster containining protein